MSERPYLAEDTSNMMRDQRLDEQAGKRHLARVYAREHPVDEHGQQNQLGLGVEEAPENDIPPHKDLDSQRWAGADKNLNIDPRNNPNAKMELENAEREQQIENQLRLGLMPGVNRAPRPDHF